MPQRIENRRRREIVRKPRPVLGVERLESRVLLAGLINVCESIFPTFTVRVEEVARLDAVYAQPVGESIDAQTDVKNGHTSDMCQPGDEEHPDNCPGLEFNADEIDNVVGRPQGDTSQAAPRSQPVEPAPTSPFISPVATSLNQLQGRDASATAAATTVPTSSYGVEFHYFANMNVAADEQQPSLDRDLLVNHAVKETFFAYSLLENSNLSQVIASGDGESKIEDVTDKVNRMSLVSVGKTQVDDTVENARFMHPDAEAAIVLAKQVIRDVDALVSLPNAEATDVAIAQVFDGSTGIAIASKPERSGSDRIRWASLNQDWQLGLFGLLSLFVSTQSNASKKENPESVRFDKSRR